MTAPKDITPRPCEQCGESFLPHERVQRFCSRVCARKSYRADFSTRFWSKVDKHSGLFWDGTECWLWLGNTDGGGYGQFHLDGREQKAHRVAYRLAHGPIPEGLRVLHHCDRPGCVRGEHLFAGTQSENMADAFAKGRLLIGQHRPLGRLTEDEVRAIRTAYTGTRGEVTALAAKYGVALSAIYGVVRRQTWRHVPDGPDTPSQPSP